MLLLAVQWGGNRNPWKSATTIGLIVGFVVMTSIFAVWEWHQQDEASIPPRIMGQRSVYSAAAIVFFGLGSVQILGYYLPMWFQVIKGVSPVGSGIRFLPMVLGNFVGAILFGGLGMFFPSSSERMKCSPNLQSQSTATSTRGCSSVPLV